MSATAVASTDATASTWRLPLAISLLFLAALPVQVYAVPGFEITPALLLSPVALLLFRPREPLHLAVVAIMAFCFLLALVGPTGSEGRIRNVLGAASHTSGVPYFLVGMTLARHGISLQRMWQVVSVVAAFMVVALAVDMVITGGNLVDSAAYSSTSYQSAETTFVESVFPFYGKYAVITFATIAAAIAGLSLASSTAFGGQMKGTLVLSFSAALLFMAFSMWTRQVMLGTVIFFTVLLVLSYRRKEAWLALAVFLVLLVPWMMFLSGTSDTNVAGEIVNSKIVRGIENVGSGNFDDLSTGRLPLYRDAITRLTPQILAMGCGFCDLVNVMNFPFSSLHNAILTAIYKGGLVYAVLYAGGAFAGLALLWTRPKSFQRDATIAVLASLAAQSMVNDVLSFQVIPALLFALTGYLGSHWWNDRRGRPKPSLR